MFKIFLIDMNSPFYFDYMASTPCHPDVIEAMNYYLNSDAYSANPSSDHSKGQLCKVTIQNFEKKFLNILGVSSGRIVWTSGATEAINLALLGACRQYSHCGSHVISLVTEHSATLESLKVLQREGFETTLLPVEPNGLLDLSLLKQAIRRDTLMVTIMHVQNEMGCVQNIDEIAKICHQNGVLFHIDCAQTIGKACPRLPEHTTFASFSAHKCYGPKGIGALYLNDQPKRKLKPIITGGAQQNNLRAGTIPLFLIAGFVKALELYHDQFQTHAAHYHYLKQLFVNHLHTSITWNSSINQGIAQLINISLPPVDLDQLSHLKEKFCISSHSACRINQRSHVLDAIGIAQSSQAYVLRISLGQDTNESEIMSLVAEINQLVVSFQHRDACI